VDGSRVDYGFTHGLFLSGLAVLMRGGLEATSILLTFHFSAGPLPRQQPNLELRELEDSQRTNANVIARLAHRDGDRNPHGARE
jgi:hypothetical protein